MSKNGAGYDPAIEDVWPLEDQIEVPVEIKHNYGAITIIILAIIFIIAAVTGQLAGEAYAQ